MIFESSSCSKTEYEQNIRNVQWKMRDPKVRDSIQNEFSLWLMVQINERLR